eukprot:s3472_g9.t1
MGRKVAGLKCELLDRLKELCNKNNRGWEWRHGCRTSCSTYLAQGEHRLVYKGEYTKGPRKGEASVWKVFKTGSVFEARFFDEDINASRKAASLIKKFNIRNSEKNDQLPIVHMNEPEVWVEDGSGKKGLVEPFIEGQYQKFNSNTGRADPNHPLMQALSHYSWHVSEGEYLLCDLQGCFACGRYLLTDPVVLSMKREFGGTDGGEAAMKNFFAHHVCGRYCCSAWSKPAPPVVRQPACAGTSFFFR